jgi:hypothetical protein
MPDTAKKPRNVKRDTPCPKCGKLFVKNALRMHEPWCGIKSTPGGAGKAEGGRTPSAGEQRSAPPAPQGTTPAKSTWLYD